MALQSTKGESPMTTASNRPTIRLEDLAFYYEAKAELWAEAAFHSDMTDAEIEAGIDEQLDWESYLI